MQVCVPSCVGYLARVMTFAYIGAVSVSFSAFSPYQSFPFHLLYWSFLTLRYRWGLARPPLSVVRDLSSQTAILFVGVQLFGFLFAVIHSILHKHHKSHRLGSWHGWRWSRRVIPAREWSDISDLVDWWEWEEDMSSSLRFFSMNQIHCQLPSRQKSGAISGGNHSMSCNGRWKHWGKKGRSRQLWHSVSGFQIFSQFKFVSVVWIHTQHRV